VNNIFGALVRSERYGIVYNDQMDDFSLPSQKNFFGFEPSRVNYVSTKIEN
jgi:gamma-glutamyltranspeptidase